MQSLDRVLLRKSADGGFVEVGTLTERIKGKTYRLVQLDGSQVEHELGHDEVQVVRGSINHRLRVEPATVEAQLRDSPQTTFRQLLAESPKGAKASDLKSKLHGIDRALVDKAWDRAKKVLDASEDVRRSSAKTPTYTLVIPTTDDMSAEVPSPEGEAPPENEAQKFAPPSATPDASPSTAGVDGRVPLEGAQRLPPSGSAEFSSDALVKVLSRHGLVEPDADLDSLIRRPLFLGHALSRLKRAELAEVLPTLDIRHRVLIAMVLGPSTEQLRSEVEHVPKGAYEEALRAGAGEVNSAASANGRQLSLLTALVNRATSSHSIDASVLVGVANTFAEVERTKRRRRDHGPAARHAVEHAPEARAGLVCTLEALARHDAFIAKPRSGINLSDVARAAKQAVFARTGGRSLLVSALYRQSPEAARDSMWWEDVTFGQLADAGHGPLSVALEDDVIAARVVRPLVEVTVRAIATRSQLAQVMSASAPVARWVSGNDVKAALLRIGNNDSVASAWADVMADTLELARMEEMLSRARSEMDSSAATQRELRHHVAHLEHRLKVTGEELAAARGAQSDARGAHDRQVKADLMKVLAKVAAQVSQSVSASQDDALVRSISHATAREGLEPVGAVGQRASFDPQFHDPLGLTISADTPVTVVRPGYTWRDGTENIVLLKAQVVPNGE